MDCHAAVITFLFIAQAAYGPVGDATAAVALKQTIQLMRDEIRTALSHISETGLPPNVSCQSLNTTGLTGPEPLTAHQLPLYRCYMLKLSKETEELSPQLVTVSQYSKDVETMKKVLADNRNCSIPQFDQNMGGFVYAKCLLDLLDRRLSNARV